MTRTPHDIEFGFFQTRPDLWSISKAIKHCVQYREQLIGMLTPADAEVLEAYRLELSAAIKAHKGV